MTLSPPLDLSPCPFCGGEAVLEEDRGRATDEVRWSVGCKANEAACMGYQSLTTYARRTEAIKAWNTRSPTPPSADAEVAALVKRLNEWSLIPPRYNLSIDSVMCKEAADALERLARDLVIETAKAQARQEGLALGVEMRETAEASLREAEDKWAKAEATVAGMVKWLEENQGDVFSRGIYEAADAARQAGKGGSE